MPKKNVNHLLWCTSSKNNCFIGLFDIFAKKTSHIVIMHQIDISKYTKLFDSSFVWDEINIDNHKCHVLDKRSLVTCSDFRYMHYFPRLKIFFSWTMCFISDNSFADGQFRRDDKIKQQEKYNSLWDNQRISKFIKSIFIHIYHINTKIS